jgi:hypothetical protein
MKYIPIGVDIAKHLIQVHFIDEYSGEVIDKQIRAAIGEIKTASNCEPPVVSLQSDIMKRHYGRSGNSSIAGTSGCVTA